MSPRTSSALVALFLILGSQMVGRSAGDESPSWEHEEVVVPITSVPPNVMSILKKNFPEQLVAKADVTMFGTSYDVTIVYDDRRWADALISADGTRVAISKPIEIGDIPKPIKGTTLARWPQATVISVRQHIGAGRETYVVKLSGIDGGFVKVDFDSNGNVTRVKEFHKRPETPASKDVRERLIKLREGRRLAVAGAERPRLSGCASRSASGTTPFNASASPSTAGAPFVRLPPGGGR